MIVRRVQGYAYTRREEQIRLVYILTPGPACICLVKISTEWPKVSVSLPV